MRHTILKSGNGGYLEFLKLLNDASWASFSFL